MLYRFEVRVCEEIFAKRAFGGFGPFGVNQRFLSTLMEKNIRRFKQTQIYIIYVPSSSSSEKKHNFDERWVFNFLPAKV